MNLNKIYCIVIINILFVNYLFAQVQTDYIFKESVGSIDVSFSKNINKNKGVEWNKVSLIFRNEKYTTLYDYKALSFIDSTEFKKFRKELKMCYNEMSEKKNLQWNNDKYSIVLFDSTILGIYYAYIYCNDDGAPGYTTISRKKLLKLIELLDTVKFTN